MDALCTLFDAVSCVSELLGRREEKADELSALLSTVGSVSQSVRSFALELPPHEREAVFRLNPVFSDLAHQLRQWKTLRLSYGNQFQPVIAFVSKEHFVLDVSRSPPQAEAPDTMNMDTLNLGGEEDLGPTLALGSSTDSGVREQVPDATVYGLSQHGLHVRELGQNTWRWTPMKQRVELRYGDTMAVILVSPPNSTEPGPQRDLSDSEAECKLGLELKKL